MSHSQMPKVKIWTCPFGGHTQPIVWCAPYYISRFIWKMTKMSNASLSGIIFSQFCLKISRYDGKKQNWSLKCGLWSQFCCALEVTALIYSPWVSVSTHVNMDIRLVSQVPWSLMWWVDYKDCKDKTSQSTSLFQLQLLDPHFSQYLLSTSIVHL